MLHEIINYLEIDPLLGTAGQPEKEEFSAVKAAGYELVINLLPPSSTDALPGEPALVASLGMDYISIPVIWERPTSANLAQFFESLRTNRARKVFAHCAMNMRVSAFVFLYRVLEERVQAEVAIEAMHMIWEPIPVWQSFIDEELRKANR
jgi:protein tyrosine phosphatase (PTP) superfamily phosphohydrolase (DUF442 family)